ncbi:hypothetical protein GGS20DRAFT_591655 [Poronia punctata]|nr:hypothetical protein GGS20DRAFT_591655 [Poronia punctata]
MVSVTSKALRQPGFAFVKAGAPVKPKELAEKFNSAVIGSLGGTTRTEELRSRVSKRMEHLFRLCLANRPFFLASRESDLFWDVVAEQWDTLEHVTLTEAAAFAQVYCTAREKCGPEVPTGSLARAVDEFLKMRKELELLKTEPDSQHFQVALRPSYPQKDIHSLASLSLDPGPDDKVAQWPPTHYTEQEVAWLCHDHVLSQVYGLTPAKKIKKASDIPAIPDAYAHPLDVRLFLAFTALTNLESDRKTSVCMAPIAFWDDDERKDWHRATGGASKFCWTPWEFCVWAKQEFERGQESVVGLCHFAQTSFRYSVGLLLRKRKENWFELVMEDSFYHKMSNDQKYYSDEHDLDTGMDFKSAVVEDIQRNFRIRSFWYGGFVPNAFNVELPDSVGHSCSFVTLAVQGKVPELYLNRDNWNFSREVPEGMNFVEEEESVVVFENDGVDSDVPVEEREEDNNWTWSSSDDEELAEDSDEDMSDEPFEPDDGSDSDFQP